MDVWPGKPFPLGPMWDGNGTNFSLFSENAERVELCLFDGDDGETRVELSERDGVQLALLPPRRRARASATATASTAPYDPATGQPLQPAQAPDRPVREGDRGADRLGRGERAAVRPERRRGRRPRTSTTRTTRAAIPKCVVIDPSFDWEDDRAARAPVERDRHLRGARQGLHEAAPGRARGPARHVRRARLGGRRSSTSRRSA